MQKDLVEPFYVPVIKFLCLKFEAYNYEISMDEQRQQWFFAKLYFDKYIGFRQFYTMVNYIEKNREIGWQYALEIEFIKEGKKSCYKIS